MPTTSYVYANTSCTVAWGGSRLRLVQGQTWHADDPFVQARPEFFADAPTDVASSAGYAPATPAGSAPVEQATQAPGERRATTRRPRAPSGA